MGSDGLFDNLYDHDIEGCLKPSVKQEKQDQKNGFSLEDPEAVAKCMAGKAYGLGKDRRYMSPFAQGAMKSGRRYIGGKEDDITVIVAQIINK